MAHVLPQPTCLHLGIALVAEGPSPILDETRVCQFHAALLASEAPGMPAGVHRLDDASDDELPTLVAAGSEEDVEVVLAVLATVEFVKNAVSELAETLGTTRNENFSFDWNVF